MTRPEKPAPGTEPREANCPPCPVRSAGPAPRWGSGLRAFAGVVLAPGSALPPTQSPSPQVSPGGPSRLPGTTLPLHTRLHTPLHTPLHDTPAHPPCTPPCTPTLREPVSCPGRADRMRPPAPPQDLEVPARGGPRARAEPQGRLWAALPGGRSEPAGPWPPGARGRVGGWHGSWSAQDCCGGTARPPGLSQDGDAAPEHGCVPWSANGPRGSAFV